jgi:hypothetical protein
MKTITGQDVNRANIISQLKTLKSSRRDVILFYFTGHGFRYKKESSDWPHMYLSSKNEDLRGVKVAKILKDKKPSLLVILFDCCNSYAKGLSNPFTQGLLSPKALPGLSTLFFRTKGLVIATASSPGHSATAFPDGGLFTSSLITSMNKESQKPKVSWERVMKETATRSAHVQKPVYLVKTSQKRS